MKYFLLVKIHPSIHIINSLLTANCSVVRRKFSWRGLIQWHVVAICIWCARFVKSQFDVIFIFQTNILAKFVDIIGIFFLTHSPYFMCLCTEYILSALQCRISEENKLNATTQQFITAKISVCVLKQCRKTHSSLCQSNLQLQNSAALMSRPIRAVEHRCAAGLAGTHPGLQDRILLNYTQELGMCMKYARKLAIFCYL